MMILINVYGYNILYLIYIFKFFRCRISFIQSTDNNNFEYTFTRTFTKSVHFYLKVIITCSKFQKTDFLHFKVYFTNFFKNTYIIGWLYLNKVTTYFITYMLNFEEAESDL